MRKKLKRPPNHKDERTISRFAWFPIVIHYELRWLECVTIRQRYIVERGRDIKWYSLEFVD